MTTKQFKQHKQYSLQATQLSIRAEEELPPGVVGRLTGVALVYNETDAYGTQFAPGALDRTRSERMAGGKIKLFADHMSMTSTHVGVVRSLSDVGDTVVMTADLFDTAEGRKMKEYLAAVMAANAETGLSIGFIPRRGMPHPDDPSVYVFTEIELREISVTPVPAVPGAEVAGVRQTDDEEFLPEQALRVILAALSEEDARRIFDDVFSRTTAVTDDDASVMPDSTPSASATEETVDAAETEGRAKTATMDERIAALRASFRLVSSPAT